MTGSRQQVQSGVTVRRLAAAALSFAGAILMPATATEAQPAGPAATSKLPIEVVVPQFHTGSFIYAFSLSPDGRILASGGEDGTIKIWNSASLQLIRTIRTGRANVWSLAYLPDGKTVISRGPGGIDLWDVLTGGRIGEHRLAADNYSRMAVAADGRIVVSVEEDNIVCVRETLSGKIVQRFPAQRERINAVTLSPDGKRIAYGGDDHTVKVWEISGTLVRTIQVPESGTVWSVTFAPSGANLTVGFVAHRGKESENNIATWAVTSGNRVHGWPEKTPQLPNSTYAPDGRTFTSVGGRTLKLWDSSSGELVRTLDEADSNFSAATFSRDGKYLFGGDMNNAIWRFDLEGGTHRIALRPPASPVLKFVARDQVVLTEPEFERLWTETFGRIYLLDSKAGELSRVAMPAGPIGAQSFSCQTAAFFADRDADDLIGTIDHAANALGAIVPKLTSLADGTTRQIEAMLSPDGRQIAISPSYAVGGELPGENHPLRNIPIEIWDTKRLERSRELPGQVGNASSSFNEANPLCFSADGKLFAGVGGDGAVRIWDVASGRQLHKFEAHTVPTLQAIFTRNGNQLVTSGDNGSFYDSAGKPREGDDTVKVWDVKTGNLITVLKGATSPFMLSADGRWLAAGAKGTTLWDTTDWRLVHSFEGKQRGFTPDGKFVITTESDWMFDGRDRSVRVWSTATGELVRKLDGHLVAVSDVAISSDGRVLVSQGRDGVLKLWNLETGTELATVYIASPDQWVVLTPEGFFNSSARGADLVTVVRGLDHVSIDQLYQVLFRPDLVREKLAGDPQGKVREAAARLDLDKVIASGPAPGIMLSAGRQRAAGDDVLKVRAAEVEFSAHLTDTGGGIGSVEWRINGVTLGVETRGFSRISTTSAPLVLTRKLSLVPGENNIEVVAYNAANLIASKPVSLIVRREGVEQVSKPVLHVLAVGVNEYWDSRLRLTFASADAKALAEALRGAGGTLFERVEVTTVLDEAVTTAVLDKNFAAMSAKVRADDVFVFFLAGHGKTVDGRYYFLPHDFRYGGDETIVSRGIGQDRWQEWFARIAARKSLLLYDTCESGSLAGDRVAMRGIERVAALERMTRATGRTTLTASTDDTPALEGYRGHGVFTYALLDGLAKADANGDGLVDVTELAGFIDTRVPDISFQAFRQRQVPQMRIVGSNFPVASKGTPLAGDDAVSIPISSKPTHMVIAPANVYAQPGATGQSSAMLAPGMMVTLVRAEKGWVLVARDGKQVGYVAQQHLLAAQ